MNHLVLAVGWLLQQVPTPDPEWLAKGSLQAILAFFCLLFIGLWYYERKTVRLQAKEHHEIEKQTLVAINNMQQAATNYKDDVKAIGRAVGELKDVASRIEARVNTLGQ